MPTNLSFNKLPVNIESPIDSAFEPKHLSRQDAYLLYVYNKDPHLYGVDVFTNYRGDLHNTPQYCYAKSRIIR